MSQPEHSLQTKVCDFVRDCVTAPHLFLAFDRTRAQSEFQHVREAARGIRAGTPDTLLMVLGLPDIWCELKVGSNRPTSKQDDVGADIVGVGRVWGWCSSVEQYRQMLLLHQVPLSRYAVLRAMEMDALLDRAPAKKRLQQRIAAQTKASGKRRGKRPTPAQVRRAEAARLLPR